jgi:hypothetical protein
MRTSSTCTTIPTRRGLGRTITNWRAGSLKQTVKTSRFLAEQFERFIEKIFATDRALTPKGMIEVVL